MLIKLRPHQYKFVTSEYRTTVLIAGRGAGKSFASGCLIANELQSGRSVLAMAPTYKDLEAVLIKETRDRLDDANVKYKYNKQNATITMKDKTIAYFRSTENPESSRGLTNVSTLVIDEGALVPFMAYLVAKACLRGKKVRKPKTFVITSPKGKANWVSGLYYKDDTYSLHAKSSDNPHNGKGYVEGLRSDYDSHFARQELDGEILDSTTSSVFNSNHFTQIFDASNILVKTSPIILTLDVARDGADESCATLRVGGLITKVLHKHTSDLNALKFLAMEVLGGLVPDHVAVDCTGMGQFIPDVFAELWPKAYIYRVDFGSKFKIGFTNRRTEIHFGLRDAICNGSIRIASGAMDDLTTAEFEKELYAVEYSIDGKTNYKLASKDDIKKKIGRSPDILDSVALQSVVDINDLLSYQELVNKANSRSKYIIFPSR